MQVQTYEQSRSTEPAYQSVIVSGVLRQIEEPRIENGPYKWNGCPCLCVPKTDIVTGAPCWGGFAVIGIGCRD